VTPAARLPRLPAVSPSRPTALAAFLRSIEPRARVLALAQAGPALEVEALLAELRQAFGERAPRLPLAEWPLRYWGLLLAREALMNPPAGRLDHPLYLLSPTRRLALLLRLVVGLEPAGAARVMGLSAEAFSTLLADAEEKLAVAGVGPAVLLRWQEEFQAAVREAAAPAPSAGPVPPPARPPGARRLPGLPGGWRGWRPGPLQVGLGLVALLLLAVLVATFVWPPGPMAPASPAASPEAAPAALAPVAPAAPRRQLDAELPLDPDFALLAEPAASPWREDLGFLAWWVAQQGRLPPPPPPAAPPPADWSGLPAEARRLLAPLQAAWPALEPEARAGLLANVERWQGAEAGQRTAWVAAYAEWLALPAQERSQRRAAYARWRSLDAVEREALTAAAARFAALPEAERQALRERFTALDEAARGDWALGPRLGAQLPALRPLFAFLPAGEQAALLEALDALDEAQRQRLGARVAAMGVAERAALRGRVLAAEPEARAALLAEAAAP